MTLETQAIIAVVFFGALAVAIAIALMIPPKHRDPHDGVARGCLMFVILGLLGLVGMIVIGVTNDIDWFVRLPFKAAAFCGVLLAINAVRWVYMKIARRP